MLPLLLIGAVGVVLLAASSARAAAPVVQKVVTGSSKTLVKYTLVNNRVTVSPQVLWSEAQTKAGFKFTFKTFLLASLAASEYNSGSQLLKSAVMHAALNYAKKYKRTLEGMLIPDGKLGGQKGRYASTAHPPTLNDVKIAQAVEAGTIKDPTGGAVQFDSPRTQLYMWKKGDPDHKHPLEIAKDRMNSGKTVAYLPGEDPENARFWRPIA